MWGTGQRGAARLGGSPSSGPCTGGAVQAGAEHTEQHPAGQGDPGGEGASHQHKDPNTHAPPLCHAAMATVLPGTGPVQGQMGDISLSQGSATSAVPLGGCRGWGGWVGRMLRDICQKGSQDENACGGSMLGGCWVGQELEETLWEHVWGGGFLGTHFGRMLTWEEVSWEGFECLGRCLGMILGMRWGGCLGRPLQRGCLGWGRMLRSSLPALAEPTLPQLGPHLPPAPADTAALAPAVLHQAGQLQPAEPCTNSGAS